MNFKILLPAIIFTIFLTSSVLAIPGIPHQFYGTVTVNGQSAPDGTTVAAKINGVEVKSTTVSSGEYSLIIDDPQNDRSGDTVNFFVKGVDTGQSFDYCNGCSEELDLSATVDEGGNGNNGGNSGSSGSSSNSGDETTTTIEEEPKETSSSDECREKWVCTDWSYCIDGKQTRTCTEENDCGTDLYKPFEEQPCVIEEGKQAVGFDLGATGRFLTSPVGIGTTIAVLVAVILSLFYWKKKSKKKE